MNNLKRDRFELLSAYLDGEVTAAERRQVEGWLECDPSTRCLYERLLKLRQSMRTLPVPSPEQSGAQAANQVFNRLNRRRQHRAVWGSLAVASLLVGLSSVLPSSQQVPVANVATYYVAPEDSAPEVVPSESLMIALDRPIIETPKAPVSSPIAPGQTLLYESSGSIR